MSSVEHGRPQGVTRRDALKKGALTGAAIVWTVPVVQSIGMTAAHADDPSGVDVLPTKQGTKEPPAKGNTPAVPETEVLGTRQGGLAATGAGVPVAGVAATAAASVAVGGALIAASRKRQQPSPDQD